MPVRLIVIKDQKPIDQFVVKGEAVIGRKSESDVPIKDPAISGSHARVVEVGENWVIEDLGSTNGIVVAGERVQQHVLKNDDLITVGEHQIKVLITEGRNDDTESPLINPAVTAPQGEGFLKVVKGKGKGTKITLTESLTTIGEPGIQVAAVSKRPTGHFIIHVDAGRQKDRVPLVNGEPTGFKSRKLDVGDRVVVADIEMEYCRE